MMLLLILNTPPGLKRQLIVSGIFPIAFSKKSICVKSSKLIVAPILSAKANSSAGVSFEENMISSPEKPSASDIISSVMEEQSHPHPYSLNTGLSPSLPSSPYSSQVRFLNASTNGQDLDVWIDGRNIFSGSTFATVSSYIQVSDGFHTVTVRRTNGPALYRRTLSFISGEKVTMVLLDTPGGITLSRVSDMGCTNIPAGYGCLRVANMSYSGSNYDVRTFNNQIVFGGVGFKGVTTFKQTAAGNYTFFVTASRRPLRALQSFQ